MLSIDAFLQDRYPDFWQSRPLLARPLVRILKLVFHEQDFRQFSGKYPYLQGFDFVEQVLEYFQFSYTVRDNERERIPVHGRIVVIANHPIRPLDGLPLLILVRAVRSAVKVVANNTLSTLTPLHKLLLPVENMGGNTPRRNSAFFYALSFVARPISTLWLVREMFKQARNCVDIRIGERFSPESYQGASLNIAEKAELFRRQVYRIGRDRTGIFSTDTADAHPENRALLREEILKCDSAWVKS